MFEYESKEVLFEGSEILNYDGSSVEVTKIEVGVITFDSLERVAGLRLFASCKHPEDEEKTDIVYDYVVWISSQAEFPAYDESVSGLPCDSDYLYYLSNDPCSDDDSGAFYLNDPDHRVYFFDDYGSEDDAVFLDAISQILDEDYQCLIEEFVNRWYIDTYIRSKRAKVLSGENGIPFPVCLQIYKTSSGHYVIAKWKDEECADEDRLKDFWINGFPEIVGYDKNGESDRLYNGHADYEVLPDRIEIEENGDLVFVLRNQATDFFGAQIPWDLELYYDASKEAIVEYDFVDKEEEDEEEEEDEWE